MLILGMCPIAAKLSCIKVLLSYACESDSDCGMGLACCSTKCDYGPKMCVQKGLSLIELLWKFLFIMFIYYVYSLIIS